MERKQAIEIMKFLKSNFPQLNFEDDNVAKTWLTVLTKNCDYVKTVHKAKFYIMNNKYQPKISDIAVMKPKVIEKAFKENEKTRAERIAEDEQAKKRNDELRAKWLKVKEKWEDE